MENDIIRNEALIKVVQDEAYPLIGFQSVIMGIDYTVRRGVMDKNRLITLEELLRPYANISGLKLALKRRRSDVPPHITVSFNNMLDKVRGDDSEMTELMYNLYFKIIYSLHYGETPPCYEEAIKKITEIASLVNMIHRDQKAARKLEKQIHLGSG